MAIKTTAEMDDIQILQEEINNLKIIKLELEEEVSNKGEENAILKKELVEAKRTIEKFTRRIEVLETALDNANQRQTQPQVVEVQKIEKETYDPFGNLDAFIK